MASTANTFTGNLTINAGTVAFDGDSDFVIGANGVNNSIDGTGSAIFNGSFTFVLTGIDTALGNAWEIVDVAALTETWASNFSVTGFSHAGGGVWTRNNSGTLYEFSQTTGQLSVIPEPSSLALAGVAGCLLAGGLAGRRKRPGCLEPVK